MSDIRIAIDALREIREACALWIDPANPDVFTEIDRAAVGALDMIDGHRWHTRKLEWGEVTACTRCGVSKGAAEHFGWTRCQ